eukprot:gb/GECG01003459.1/.p1 GENE.gb/GECG01003459.1/~~gb/GECG01003459.1/.p1  ORF type:complete len:1172 (+),score=138.48 gb/GECG01003459.1/:1-3516(+)
MTTQNGSLTKEAILPIVRGYVDASATQPSAMHETEQQLLRISGQPGFAVSMAEILRDQQRQPYSVRQLAAIMLRRHVVEARWDVNTTSGYAENGSEGAPLGEEEKGVLRRVFMECIGDPTRRVRSLIAVLLGSIGGIEWPDIWSDMVSQLVQYVQNSIQEICSNPAGGATEHYFNLIDGALLSLVSLAEQVGLEAVLRLNREVMPLVIKLLESDLSGTSMKLAFVLKIRGRAFHLARSCASSLKVPASVEGEEGKQAVQFIDELRNPLCRIIFTELRKTFNDPNTDVFSQQQALVILQCLLSEHPKAVQSAITTIVQELFHFLGSSRESFNRYVVLGEDSSDPAYGTMGETDDDYDSEGEEHSLESVIEQALSVVCTIIGSTSKQIRKTLKGSVREIIQGVVPFMQLSSDSVETWEDDPNEFVLEEENNPNSSLRQTGCDLVGEIVEMYGHKTLGEIVSACDQMIDISGLIRNLNEVHASGLQARPWRIYEACFMVIGCIGPTLAKAFSQTSEDKRLEKYSVDIPCFIGVLHQIIKDPTVYLPLSENYDSTNIGILRARAIWCAGRLATAVSDDTAASLVSVIIDRLNDTYLPICVAACQALARYLRKMGRDSVGNHSAYLSTALNRTATLLQRSPEGSMVSILDTLRTLVDYLPTVAAEYSSQLVSLLLALWIKYANDPVIGPATSDILSSLMANPDKTVANVVSEKLLPVINSILENPDEQSPGVRESSLEMLRCLVDNVARPVPSQLLHIFPSVARYAKEVSTDDSGALQSICDTLASFVLAAPREISELSTGLPLVLETLDKVLGPGPSDTGVLYSGKLVTAVATKLGPQMGYEQLTMLIQAVVRRLGKARLPSLIQALVVAIASLVALEPTSMVEILSSTEVSVVTGPLSVAAMTSDYERGSPSANIQWKTENGLVLLMKSIIDHLRFFQGTWERKICTLVLAQLLSMEKVLPAVRNVTVDGDEIFAAARTRSQTRNQPKQYQQLSLPSRAIMVIARAYMEFASADEEGEWEGDSEEETDEDDEGVDEGPAQATGYSSFVDPDEMVFLSDMLGGGNMVDVSGKGPLVTGGVFADGDDELDGSEEEEEAQWAKEHPWYTLDAASQLKAFFELMEGRYTDLNDVHPVWWAEDSPTNPCVSILHQHTEEAVSSMMQDEKLKLQKLLQDQ